MHRLIANKLARYVDLDEQDGQRLAEVLQGTIRTGRAHRDIVREGDRPGPVRIILDGWAVKHKMLPDGRRQITSIALPGDIVNLDASIFERMDHSLGAATPLTFAEVPRERISWLCEQSPALGTALEIDRVARLSIQREWTVNLGQRTARERLAHMMCEIFVRLQACGLAEGWRCEMPLTQCDLGEASGMTAVHVNRTLQEMRRDGLLNLSNRILTIPSFDALADVAMFSSAYLHLRGLENVNESALD